MDMFFELFNIKPPEWHQAFLDGRRLTSEFHVLRVVFIGLTRAIVYRRNRIKDAQKTGEGPPSKQEGLKLTDQFVALLILVFSDAGLVDVSIEHC